MKERTLVLVAVLVCLVGVVAITRWRAEKSQRSKLDLRNNTGIPVSIVCGDKTVSLSPGQLWTTDFRVGTAVRASGTFEGLRVSGTNLLFFVSDAVPARVQGVIHVVREIRDMNGQMKEAVVLPTDIKWDPHEGRSAITNLMIVTKPVWVPE